MTKKVLFTLIVLATLLALSASDSNCTSNYQHIDTVHTFDRAIISLPNGEVVSGRVDLWRDFGDGDQLQIQIDGTWYLVHSTNCVLMKFED